MSDNPRVTDKYPSLVIPGYIYSAKGEPLTISSLAVLPLKAADKFIVGYLRSVAVRLSKMQDHKSLLLR
jgi:hypothetical protein